MISVKEMGNMLDFIGLSTDTKPTWCANGSAYYEMDTSKIYLFDKANNQWLEIGTTPGPTPPGPTPVVGKTINLYRQLNYIEIYNDTTQTANFDHIDPSGCIFNLSDLNAKSFSAMEYNFEVLDNSLNIISEFKTRVYNEGTNTTIEPLIGNYTYGEGSTDRLLYVCSEEYNWDTDGATDSGIFFKYNSNSPRIIGDKYYLGSIVRESGDIVQVNLDEGHEFSGDIFIKLLKTDCTIPAKFWDGENPCVIDEEIGMYSWDSGIQYIISAGLWKFETCELDDNEDLELPQSVTIYDVVNDQEVVNQFNNYYDIKNGLDNIFDDSKAIGIVPAIDLYNNMNILLWLHQIS